MGERQREREAAAVSVLPAVWRMASVAGSSHLWEFPGCKLALAGRAQQGSCVEAFPGQDKGDGLGS